MGLNFNASNDVEKPETLDQGLVVQTQIIDPERLKGLFQKFRGKIDSMTNEVMGLKVFDDDTSARAAEMAAQARRLRAEIEKKRKKIVEPMLELNRHVKKLKNQLEEIENMACDKNQPFLEKQQRKEKEMEKKAAEKARKQAEDQKLAEMAKTDKKNEGDSVDRTEIVDSPASQEVVFPVIPDVIGKTTLKTPSGKTTLREKEEPVLVDVRKLTDACIQERWPKIEEAVLPWARIQLKAGIRNIPGFVIKKSSKVKTSLK